jgi:hypothetical protein
LGTLSYAQWSYGIFIPEPGMAMPNYWSGTNCRASGWAQIGEPIIAAELYIGGELVHDWEQEDPEEWPPMDLGLTAMFDSSHFANGSTVEIRFRVRGLYSGWHEGTSDPDPTVKNNLLVAAYYDLENAEPGGFGSTPWTNRFGTRNYTVVGGSLNTWTSADVLSELSTCNVAYLSCHGMNLRDTLHLLDFNDNIAFEDLLAPYEVQSCFEDAYGHVLCPHPSPPNPPSYLEFTFTSNVFDNRVTSIGSPGVPPFPPFNTTANPPLNLVWIDACESFALPWYNTFLIPHRNAYVGYSKTRR